MKRLYSAPEAAFVELATKPLMLVISADRVIIDVENEEAGDETPDLADEYRSDWENIWGDMIEVNPKVWTKKLWGLFYA